MRSCLVFRIFIDLESNFSYSKTYEPAKVTVMKDFGKGVRDFIYLPKYSTAFVALSDMNIISRMDSYFTNVSPYYPRHLLIILNPLSVHDAVGEEERKEGLEVGAH